MSNQLLSMMKPDGLSRVCSPGEVAAIFGAWDDLLALLRGRPVDNLCFAEIVECVLEKAKARSIEYGEYSLKTWQEQASDLDVAPPRAPHPRSQVLLPMIAEVLLESLGFVPGRTHTGWLNRVAIEMLYADAPNFQANRDLLVPLLLSGPVRIQVWYGRRRELAHALKLIIRRSISASDLTNLIHIEALKSDEQRIIFDSLLAEID